MGIDARVTVYAPSIEVAKAACAAAFERMAELDTMMSDYRKDSELMRLCDKAGGPPVHVSPELFKVLERSQEFARLTGGRFDVTVGPLVQLWRKARKTHVMPTRGELSAARKLVGYRMMTLDARAQTVKLAKAGMKLDLGAIAKGYADDEAQLVLKAHSISRALVEMGGDIVVTGAPPNTKGWDIRVPNPHGGPGFVDLHLTNCAISTSGDEEQFVVIGGVRYSHVVNPLTGYALTNGLEATVTCRDGLTSDPLSTSLTLISPRVRAKILKAYPGSRVYVRKLAR